MSHRITLVLGALALAACTEDEISAPAKATPTLSKGTGESRPGAVYTLTNQPDGNAVVMFTRSPDGALTHGGTVATGGLGTGGGLSSQGAVVLSDDQRWLVAVNAGSNDISVFAVTPAGLSLIQRISSEGVRPVSAAIRRGLVYVLNTGGSGNIAGFQQATNGALTPIPGSSRPLSAPDAGAAQVSFTPDGSALIVTERFTNIIDVYALDSEGVAGPPQVHQASGGTPFGFDFGRSGLLIVSEAFGGLPDASAASSYRVGGGGLSLVTGSLGTTETSACWLVVSADGRFAYAANTGSNTITGYAIAADGTLALLDTDGVTGPGADVGPADMGLSGDDRFLYVLTRGTNSVTIFERQAGDGSLKRLTAVDGLPAGTVGLAAR